MFLLRFDDMKDCNLQHISNIRWYQSKLDVSEIPVLFKNPFDLNSDSKLFR